MPQYAVIQNNVIVNTIRADSKEDAEILTQLECIELNDSFNYSHGYYFDGEKWTSEPRNIIEEDIPIVPIEQEIQNA